MIAMFKFVPLMVKTINGMKIEYEDVKNTRHKSWTKKRPNNMSPDYEGKVITKKNNFKKGIDSDFL